MKTIPRAILSCIILLVLISGLPATAFAFTAGSFSVSPQSVNIGTIRVLPGSSAGPYSFMVSVVGGPIADPAIPAEKATFIASSDSSWLSIDPSNGDAPGSITVTASVSETMGEGTWTGQITIYSGLDPATTPETVTVQMTVIRSIGDLLTVSPTAIDLRVTEDNVAQQSVPITIANADPEKTVFDWSAVSNVAWLTLSKNTGLGNETISLTVNRDLLMLTTDLDGDGKPDQGTGTITIRSNIHPDAVTITVNLTMTLSDENQVKFSVSPSQLYWSVEKSSDSTTALTFNAQSLYVWGQAGWTASFDASYLSAKAYDSSGGAVNGLICKDVYGRLEVTPVADIIQTMGYGTYTSYITITDYYNLNQRQIPVTINIRQPGEQVVLPAVYQISPYYSLIEAADTSLINIKIPISLDFAYYPTENACQAASGVWINPNGVKGDLDEYCSLNQHIYVLIARPEMEPGVVYIMKKSGQLGLAYSNGVLVSGASQYSYADGPVTEIPLGPMQLLGCYGRFIVSFKVGANLSTATEVQRIQINLKTPDGLWTVTESYQGENYTYDTMPLTLSRVPGQYAYAGTWGGSFVNLVPGDGSNTLYQLIFSEAGISYVYEVQQLTATLMSGRWKFSWPGGTSAWDAFSAQRMLWVP